jgi:hypothetical protein
MAIQGRRGQATLPDFETPCLTSNLEGRPHSPSRTNDNGTAICFGLLRQANNKHSAAVLRVCRGQCPTVLRNDAMGQCEAHAMAAGLGCEEGYENALQVLGRDAFAGVFDFDCGPLLAGLIALG